MTEVQQPDPEGKTGSHRAERYGCGRADDTASLSQSHLKARRAVTGQSVMAVAGLTTQLAYHRLTQLGGRDPANHALPVSILGGRDPANHALPVSILGGRDPANQALPVSILGGRDPANHALPVSILGGRDPASQALPVSILGGRDPANQALPVSILQRSSPAPFFHLHQHQSYTVFYPLHQHPSMIFTSSGLPFTTVFTSNLLAS